MKAWLKELHVVLSDNTSKNIHTIDAFLSFSCTVSYCHTKVALNANCRAATLGIQEEISPLNLAGDKL